jgi:hypothetical protein
MKYFELGCKVSNKLGFSTLGQMDDSNFDMDLCWGNGFENDKLTTLLQDVSVKGKDDRDAFNLLYFMALTTEGSKRIVEYCKTFGGNHRIANALIKGIDAQYGSGNYDQPETLKTKKIFDTLESLLEGEGIPYVNIHKPSYITNVRFWKIITKSCSDMAEVINGLSPYDICAARVFIESVEGRFVSKEAMERWTYPGYVDSNLQDDDTIEWFQFLIRQIGERQAVLKFVGYRHTRHVADPIVKSLGSSKSLDHWKAVFRICDLNDFFNSSVSGNPQINLYDLLASSIKNTPHDLAQISRLKKSTVREMISRESIDTKLGLSIADKNNTLKGMILSDGMGL